MTIYSTRWYRVASLRPRLAPHVRVRRQRLRGETWYLLVDELTGRSCRLNRCAYALAGRFDGQRSVQALWDLLHSLDTEPPTQDEVIELLARLRESALVEFDRAADFGTLLPHLDDARPRRRRFSLLAWRMPLGDPSRVLDRLMPLQAAVFSRTALALWMAAVALLVALSLRHGAALWSHAATWMGTPRYLLLAVGVYPLIKLLHELAHGLAVRRWGGQVREAGVTLMLFMPVPYVDASAASSFPSARQRIIVSAAGIMVELAVALLGLLLWLVLDEGWLRDAGFVALVIGTVSTVLFNANPLQRLDGYYIFTDALDLPNLGPRSRSYWLDLLRRRLLRLHDVEPMPVASGERPWLIAYGPLSWGYQLAVALAIVAWLGSVSFALGVAVALMLCIQMLMRPMLTIGAELWRAARTQEASGRRLRRVTAIATAAALLMLLVPLPHHTVAQGVLWPPEQAQVRADTEGVIQTLLRKDGDIVQPDEVLIELRNAKLEAQWVQQGARIDALEADMLQSLTNDSARTGRVRAEFERAQAELARTEQRLAGLQIRAHTAGRLVLPRAEDLPGSFVRQGLLIGHVLNGEGPTVRVAIPQAEAGELRERVRGVTARLADSSGGSRPGALVRDALGAARQLPSAALSTRRGGDVQTDPNDKDSLRTLAPVVLMDVSLDGVHDDRIGLRAWVRFDEGYAPVLMQFSRWIRQQVLQRFNPQH